MIDVSGANAKMDRRIYEYPDGSSPGHMAKADPAALQRGLLRAARESGRGWFDLYEEWFKANQALAKFAEASRFIEAMKAAGTLPPDAPEPDAWKDEDAERFDGMTERIVGIAREAFGIKPFDGETGSGLLQSEVLDILYHFIGWQKKSETSTETSPCSSAPTDGPTGGPSNPSSGAPSTMSSSTDSA